jgi:hypothetical protein
MPSSRRIAVAIAGAAVLFSATACGSSGGAHTNAQPSDGPSTSSAASASPSADPSASASPESAGCVDGAKFCDTFSDKSSGWATKNATDYYYGYDAYLGGSYRIGERADRTVVATAPVKVPDVSQDYSVQVDVDAVLGRQSPATAQIGIVCWDHPTEDGSGDSAFVLFVSNSRAHITLWDGIDGSAHTIASRDVSGLLKTGGTANHLTAQCIQGTSNGGAAAQLSLTVNGQSAVSVTYPKSVKSYDWAVESSSSSEVGVLASGAGSDVFYDNFAVSSRCQPGGTFPCPSASAG